ncbi:peroxiredoxin 4, isoform CRA_b [Rattus norvegicus]|uniref:Peroxiredoxin 4, isoform CRA_b n=1 Tax=Rattus norvegicus TaxID=10116 RepID=A6IPR1_RAT|nr:peroxiredoxin 4, isoform CRA_b [Rattus norvegicus]
MTFLWVDQWMRHCVWFKPSSTLTSMEKSALLAGNLVVKQ